MRDDGYTIRDVPFSYTEPAYSGPWKTVEDFDRDAFIAAGFDAVNE